MKIEITIGNRQVLIILLFIIAASTVGLVVAYQSQYQPNVMGHSWSEMECNNCITGSNLADNSVTSAKIQDGSITNADIASTGLNADTLDGKHASELQDNITCGWTGWSDTGGCTPYGYCGGYVTVMQLYCSGGKVTQAQKTSVCASCPLY